MADTLSVILRALSFVLLFQAAGVALFVAIFGRHLTSSLGTIRRLGLLSALAGILLVGGHHALEAARAAGDLSGVFDTSLQRMVLESPSGTALTFRMVGLLLIAIGLRREGDLSVTVAVVGASLAALAFALTGHTAAHAARWAAGALLMVHLLVVAFWFGALPPLYLSSVREPPQTAAQVIEMFSAAAVWLVPGILLAGLVITFVLVPDVAVFRQPYGVLLIVKGGGFALLMGLAALNKWRFGPAIARGEESALRGFRRSVAAEYALIFGVLAVTAVMTTFFSPE